MSKEILRIVFSDYTDLESKQVEELFPELRGCKVYGIRANSQKVKIKAEIAKITSPEKVVKWVYGRVDNFTEKGISWSRWYKDKNKDNKKSSGEPFIKNTPLKDDTFDIEGNYSAQQEVSLWFEKKEDFRPALYWVEPFFDVPSLHFDKDTAGFFIIPVDFPKPYSVNIQAKNLLNTSSIDQELSRTIEEAQTTHFYYGDPLELTIKTLQIPNLSTLVVELFNNEDDTLLHTKPVLVTQKSKVSFEKPEEYLANFYGTAKDAFILDYDFKPANQKDKQSKIFRFVISYNLKVNKPVEEYINDDWKNSQQKKDGIQISRNPPEVLKPDPAFGSKTLKTTLNAPRSTSLTGYINVRFEDTEAYLKQREVPVNKMVEKEAEKLMAPGYEACHYTKIIAQRYKDQEFGKKEGESSVIFDERRRKSIKTQPLVEVIAGDTNPAFLKLMADLDCVKNCEDNLHNHEGEQVFKFFDNLSPGAQNLSVVNIKDKEVNLSLPFIYNRNSSIFPLNYFWLAKNDKIPYVLKTETCRYRNDILINVYPDIKWEVYVLIIPIESESYAHTNMPAGDVFKRHQDKATKTGVAHKNKDVDFTWEFHVKYTISGYAYDYGINLNKKIRKYLNTIVMVKDILDTLSNRKKIVEGEGNNAQNMIAKVGKKNKIPIFIDFSLPSFRAGGSWYYMIDKNEVQTTGYLELGLAPLIKAKGGIDLIAVAGYIPVVGQVLRALGYVKMGVEWVSAKVGTPVVADLWFNIYAFGQVDLKWVLALKDFSGTLQPAVTLGMGVELGFKIEARVEKVILINGQKAEKTVGGIKGELSGAAETGLKLTINAKKEKTSGFFTFLGVTMKIVGSVEILVDGGEMPKKLPKVGDSFSIVPYKKFGDFDFDLLDFK